MIPPPQQPDHLLRGPPSSSLRRRISKKFYNPYTTLKPFWKRNKPTIVVGCAIGLCCSMFLGQRAAVMLPEQIHRAFHDWFQKNFITSAKNILAGRWWVLLSSSLAHDNWPHLGINAVSLWRLGGFYAEGLGASHFVSLWVFSAISCSTAQTCWDLIQEGLRTKTGAFDPRYEGSIGASGVTCGLIGFFLYIMPEMRMKFMDFPIPLWHGALLPVAGSEFCMVTGLLPFVAHAGHLGGFAAGIAYCFGMVHLRTWMSRRR